MMKKKNQNTDPIDKEANFRAGGGPHEDYSEEFEKDESQKSPKNSNQNNSRSDSENPHSNQSSFPEQDLPDTKSRKANKNYGWDKGLTPDEKFKNIQKRTSKTGNNDLDKPEN